MSTTRPLLRYPAVSREEVAFVYAGDVWVGPKEGGAARKVTSARGEETTPRFSPDGKEIAFSGNYGGSVDVYTAPVGGGVPRRLTHHPDRDQMVDWFPPGLSWNGSSTEESWILYASRMESGLPSYWQLYRLSSQGGLPVKLPLTVAEYGAVSCEGWLAFQTVNRGYSSWRGYRGGQAPEIYLWELGSADSPRNLTRSDGNDSHPMWSPDGSKLYLLSDRGEPGDYQIWAYDNLGEFLENPKADPPKPRQVTACKGAPIRHPSIGPEDLVFELEGRIHRMPLATEKPVPLDFEVPSDRRPLRTRVENVSKLIRSYDLSPRGCRAVFEARGQIFTVPAQGDGVIRNLTRSSGVAERYPAWSPDGKYIAYFTDRRGEYQLAIRPSDGSGEERIVTHFKDGYRYRPHWSPDGRKIAFIDQRRVIQYCDLDRKNRIVVVDDQVNWIVHYNLENFRISWSPCGRWLAYARKVSNGYDAIFLFDTESAERHQVTSGFYPDFDPVFDPEGNYLFFFTSRSFSALRSRYGGGWSFANSIQIAVVPLRREVPPFLSLKNPEEIDAEAQEEVEVENGCCAEDVEEEDLDPAFNMDDLSDLENRIQILPAPAAGNHYLLHANFGILLYVRFPNTGDSQRTSAIRAYDLRNQEEWTLVEDEALNDFRLSADGSTLLVSIGQRFFGLKVAPGQKIMEDLALPTEQLETTVDRRQEWRQIFIDAWRILRDYFFDPDRVQNPNWKARRRHYLRLLEGAATRWDLDRLIEEMAGELDSSHTGIQNRGDEERAETRNVGLLGADFERRDGRVHIVHVVRGASWDVEKSPLVEAGVETGDQLLEVNGTPLSEAQDPWQLLERLAGRPVEITIGKGQDPLDPRRILLRTLSFEEERQLRYLEWVERRRAHVDRETRGRVGYVHIPNIRTTGFRELYRQLRAQVEREGLIFDARFNFGGEDPYRFLSLISRTQLLAIDLRFGEDWPRPVVSHVGPKALLVNAWTASNSEVFAFGFRQMDLGPLIGTRTFGGTVGASGSPPLVDGGRIIAPNLPPVDPAGNLIAENQGIEPSIEVEEDLRSLAGGQEDPGRDRQLQRAIKEVRKQLPTDMGPSHGLQEDTDLEAHGRVSI